MGFASVVDDVTVEGSSMLIALGWEGVMMERMVTKAWASLFSLATMACAVRLLAC